MSAYKVEEVMKTVVMDGRNGCHQIHDALPNGGGEYGFLPYSCETSRGRAATRDRDNIWLAEGFPSPHEAMCLIPSTA